MPPHCCFRLMITDIVHMKSNIYEANIANSAVNRIIHGGRWKSCIENALRDDNKTNVIKPQAKHLLAVTPGNIFRA